MSQNDFNIANQGFPSFRSDLNSALQALASCSSGDTAPSTTYANQLWVDTANNQLKIRNEDNDAWIVVADLDQVGDKSAPPDASITFAKLAATAVVTEAEGIASNDNDTTVPTSAAVDAHIPVKLNASGSPPLYACRAWVQFNGTGTPAILGSGNVSSITDRGNGAYTVNFTTALPDANYAFTATAGSPVANTAAYAHAANGIAPTAGALAIDVITDGGVRQDAAYICLAVFR